MSVEALAIVLHHSRAKGTAKLVLIGIANHDGDGGAYPTHETLARYANVDERNVRRAIDKLASLGEVVVHVGRGGDRDCPEDLRPNLYELRVSCPVWCDRSRQHRDTRRLAGRQGSLWITGGRKRPPVGNGGALAPPGGEGASAPQTVLSQPTTSGSPLTTDRARGDAPPFVPPADWRPCDECSQPQRECERRQSRLAPADQHHYRPRTPA